MSGKLPGSVPLLALLVLVASAAGTASAQQRVRYPRMYNALYELRDARQDVKASPDDFAGNREKALVAMDAAIVSLGRLLDVKVKAVRVERAPEFYKRHKDNPRLRQAELDLREAREELRETKGDFGGRKEQALRDIDLASAQVELLLKHARR